MDKSVETPQPNSGSAPNSGHRSSSCARTVPYGRPWLRYVETWDVTADGVTTFWILRVLMVFEWTNQGWPMLVMFCISQIASDKWISPDINMCVHAKIQDHGWFKRQKCSSAFPWVFPNIQQTHPTEFNGFPGQLCYKAPPGTWRARRVLAPGLHWSCPALEASPLDSLDWANRYPVTNQIVVVKGMELFQNGIIFNNSCYYNGIIII